MAQATVTWVQGKQFIGTDSTKHSIVISGTDEGIGNKPSELMLLALGSCTAYDVVGILEKKRLKLNGVQVSVKAEQDSEPPWTFRKFHVHYVVSGENLRPEDVSKAIELSESKYCSVSNTLKLAAEVTFDFEIIETAAVPA
jgi:putative redox protein